MVVHIISSHAALRHDSALTPQDMHIRSAPLRISCRVIEDVNGTQAVGPPCSPAVRSSGLAIQLVGVPRGVSFVDSHARGTYSASCSVVSGGDSVGYGGSFITGASRRKTSSSDFPIALPSNTYVISILEPSQAVDIEIDRWSVGDSNTGNDYVIRQFTVRLDPGWYRDDGNFYSP